MIALHKRNMDRGNRSGNGVRGLAVLLAAALLLGAMTGCSRKSSTTYSSSGTTFTRAEEPEIPDYYSDNGGTRIEIDAIFAAPGAGNLTWIYDSAYLDEALGSAQPTLEDLYGAVDQNPNISDRFKTLIREYCTQYVTCAPKSDRRILYHNLKTLVVKQTDEVQLILDTFSTDAAACYDYRENVITVLSQYTFEKGTWEYQILFHELSHAARMTRFSANGRNYWIQSGGSSFDEVMCDETLNTIFSVSLLGYEEPDLAYQLQSNFVDVLIRSMDNYEISDYINHSQSYFLRKLDEYSGCENYAAGMIRLLQAQREDFFDDSYKHPQSHYYPLYDFVSEVFYKSRLCQGMSFAEAEGVYAELIGRVTFDVPEEYELDLDHFREYFLGYCAELGIAPEK